MKISRENYEVVFLDFLDGKLTESEVRMLQSFLAFNPDLAVELEGLDQLVLEPGRIDYRAKDGLRKKDLKPMILQAFDHYCIASMEKDLDAEEERALQELIARDAGLKQQDQWIRKLKLIPDPALRYPEVSGLKRRSFGHLRLFYLAVPAAAIIALMLALPFFRTNGVSDPVPSAPVTGQISSSTVRETDPPILEGNLSEKESPDRLLSMHHTDPPATAATADIAPEKKDPTPATTFSVMDPSANRELIAASETLARISSRRIRNVEARQILRTQARLAAYNDAPPIAHARLSESSGSSPALTKTLWKLTDAGMQLLDQSSPEVFSIERKTDEQGRTRNLTLETPLFGFSAPLPTLGRPW